MRKLFCVAVGLLAAHAFAAEPAIVDHYNKACVICHGSGVAGAPRFGVAADWKPRLAKGMDQLLHSVKNGFNAMPPGGMCGDCTDADYKALIQYMATGK